MGENPANEEESAAAEAESKDDGPDASDDSSEEDSESDDDDSDDESEVETKPTSSMPENALLPSEEIVEEEDDLNRYEKALKENE